MNNLPTEIEDRQKICQRLLDALARKTPQPPPEWNLVKLDEEILTATKEYDQDSTRRFVDAARTAIFYLTDFSRRMPAWIDVTTRNARVVEMCEELAHEIERIALQPDEVVAEHGKLKSWLKAILAVQTCLIYREETERAIASDKAAKRSGEIKPNNRKERSTQSIEQNQKLNIAEAIWRKAQGKSANAKGSTTVSTTTPTTTNEQPSLF